MFVALSAGFFSSDYTVHARRDSPKLATITLPGIKKPGTIMVGDVPYTFRTDWKGRRTVLEFESIEIGMSERPSVWKGELVVSFAPGFSGDLGPFRLTPLGWLRGGYRVVHSEQGSPVGEIERPGSFRRDIRIDLPDAVPFLSQAFLTAVVLIEFRRQQSST